MYWYRPATKKDSSEYMEFILLYVDNMLCISENAEDVDVIWKEIRAKWEFKKVLY